MKKLYVLALAGLIYSYQVVAQNPIPTYVPTNGLVAWLPFSGNANDVSGNNNNAVRNTATLTSDRKGAPNAAYHFNGNQGQFIKCTNNNLPINKQARTFSLWMNCEGSINPNWTLTAFGYGVQTQSHCQMLGLYNGTSRYMGWLDELDQTYSYTNNKWMHIVGTFDGSEAKLYMDGNLIANGSKTDWSTLTSSHFFIGTRPDTANSYWNGKLDDLGIWNRVLTGAEIKALYTAVEPGVLPGYLPKTGLVAWYPFSGNVTDESGYGNNVVSNTASLTYDKMGNTNSAYEFNGSNGQYIKCLNKSMPLGSSPRTFSMWIYPRGAVASGESLTTFGYGEQSDGYAQMLGLYEGKVRYMSWADDYDITYAYNSQNWYHLLYTYDGTSAAIYVNGNLLGSTSKSWNTANSSNLFIGTRPDALNSFFHGKIDDIGVWNRVLSSTEIAAVYNGPTGLNPIAGEAHAIQMFPNPATQTTEIDLNDPAVFTTGSVYSTAGVKVQTFNIEKGKATLDISALDRGVYLIIPDAGFMGSLKLIKQ